MSERTRRDSNQPSPALAEPLSSADDAGARDSRPSPTPTSATDGRDRRLFERFEVTWSVDCVTEDTFLYAHIRNISEMGIFVRTTEPLPVGSHLTLRFAPPDSSDPFVLRGTVQWINAWRPTSDNPNPGMGIRFIDLSPADRERIVDTIRSIAYLRDNPRSGN